MFNSKIRIPTHLAIILDGNGRWAKQKGFIRTVGHNEGAKRVKEIVEASFKMGVKYLSVFAFSTENWKRPEEEIKYIFSLPEKYFKDNIDYFVDNDIKIMISGDYQKLPVDTVKVIDDALEKTKNNKSYIFNVMLNYGSKDEIVKACKEIAKLPEEEIEKINEESFNDYLYTKDLPPVDLLIRTSNEQRISNFMLYQIAYAEIIFVKTLWPAFHKKNLVQAFKEYGRRDRRFGGVK